MLNTPPLLVSGYLLLKKPPILVLPYTPTLSHISRPLEIAKNLKNAGFNIIFAGFNSRKSKIPFIEEEGFKCLPLYEPDPDILFNNIRHGKLAFVTQSTIEQMIKADLLLFKKVKPDLVLTDGRFSAMISTQICDIPHAAIVNASSTEYRSVPYIPMFEHSFFKKIKSKKFHQLCDTVNLKLEMCVFDLAMSAFSRLSKKFNLRSKVTATNCLAGKDITFLADIPEYFPVKNKPDNYHYIGPITWKRSSSNPMPCWWPLPENKTKKVYITMGTTGEGHLFSKVYNEFRKSDFISIVTTGNQTNYFKTIPNKIYVEDYMDGESVLQNSDIVVCHGGNGTIYQSLSMGKPIIGIPTIPDQDFNMRRVEALGAGIRISMKDALKKPEIIIQKVRYILENKDRFENNLLSLKKSIKQYSGAKMAAKIIQEYLK